MTLAAPPPDEHTFQDALVRVLRERGLEARDSWVSVRVVNAPWPRERTYTVVIAYPPARVALASALQRPIQPNAEKKNLVEVWVLDEPQARQICEGAHPSER